MGTGALRSARSEGSASFGRSRAMTAASFSVVAWLVCCQPATETVDGASTFAAVAGTVRDGGGAGVQGAVVHLEIPATRSIANTDANGRFAGRLALGLVPPATYPLMVTVTPPPGSALAAATVTDSIRLEISNPPSDTTIVNVTLRR